MESFKERRKYPRLDISVKIRHKILTDLELKMFPKFEHYVQEAQASNISVEGLCIKTEQELRTDMILGIEMFFPGATQIICGLGRVAWVAPSKTGSGFEAGIEFVAMKNKHVDEMANLVSEYLVEKYKLKDEEAKNNLKDLFRQLFRKKKNTA